MSYFEAFYNYTRRAWNISGTLNDTQFIVRHIFSKQSNIIVTVKPVCSDHLYNEIYYLWFIQ